MAIKWSQPLDAAGALLRTVLTWPAEQEHDRAHMDGNWVGTSHTAGSVTSLHTAFIELPRPPGQRAPRLQPGRESRWSSTATGHLGHVRLHEGPTRLRWVTGLEPALPTIPLSQAGKF